MRTVAKKRRARGFTLVELMIAAGLFSLIAAGAMSLVMSTSRAQVRSAHIDVAQAGLRAGFDFISRDLMSASVGASTGAMVLGATGQVVYPIVVTDSATGPDQIDLYTIDGSTGSGGAPSVMCNVLAAVSPSSTTISVDSTGTLKAGDLIELSDLQTATLLTVASVSAAGGTATITLTGTSTFPATVASYPAGSYVFRARHVTYSIDKTTFGTSATANESMLMMDVHDGNGPQPLAEGIEDLQVALGFDNNADGVITEVGSAANDDEWTYNVAGEIAPVALTNLKTVRVTLIAKSTQALTSTIFSEPAAEDRPAPAVAKDGFPRRVLRSEVVVRNFNLQ